MALYDGVYVQGEPGMWQNRWSPSGGAGPGGGRPALGGGDYARERQPHIFGAHALQYRQGGSTINSETPPVWAPELAYDSQYPYTLTEWERDCRRWMGATKVSAERQGTTLALAVGGAGRTVADTIEDYILRDGLHHDFNDGRGVCLHSGADVLFRVLQQKFPEDAEAQMIRAGLEFFGFTPRRGETLRALFLRFDT